MRFCLPGLCFPRISGATLGQVQLPFLGLLGMETPRTVGLATGPCLSFPLPLCSLASSWAPSGHVGSVFGRQRDATCLTCPAFAKYFCPAFKGPLPPVSGSALDSHPLPHHVPVRWKCPLAQLDASQPWQTDTVRRDPRPCPKECCPVAASASSRET